MNTIAKADNLTKTYMCGQTAVNALDSLSLEIHRGEFAVIVGLSGAGKTTLLNIMGGMDTATAGSLFIDGADVTAMDAKQLTRYRRTDIGFVFRFYNLMPNLTALGNVELATELCKNAANRKKFLLSSDSANVRTTFRRRCRTDGACFQLYGFRRRRVCKAVFLLRGVRAGAGVCRSRRRNTRTENKKNRYDVLA